MLRSFILTCAKPSKKIKKEKVEVGVGRREGREELPVPKLLRSLFPGGNLENPFCLLTRQVFLFSAACVILFQMLKVFLPPLPEIIISLAVRTHTKFP